MLRRGATGGVAVGADVVFGAAAASGADGDVEVAATGGVAVSAADG